jgi:selenocysteine-specific elongation factor
LAKPGMRTAINLPDVEVGKGPESIERGDVIATADVSAASRIVDVFLEKSSRLNPKEPVARPLKNGTSAHLHLCTARVGAKVMILEGDAIAPGERAIAQLRLNPPILAFVGDRIIVRDSSERSTIAGGIVLDLDGDRKRFRDEAQSELLRARASAAENVDVYIQSQLRRDGSAETKTSLVKSHFGANEIAGALSRLDAGGEIVLRGEIAANSGSWQVLIEHASKLIDQAHEKYPEERGLEMVELRAALGKQSEAVFEALILDLCGNGFVHRRTVIARHSHRASLPADLRGPAEKIRSALSIKPFDPPGRKELAWDQQRQRALRFLIEAGDLVELSNEIVLTQEAAQKMQQTVTEFISGRGPATASQLREEIGSSRRVIIPFLEHLDRIGVTQRSGDLRRLRESKSTAIARS